MSRSRRGARLSAGRDVIDQQTRTRSAERYALPLILGGLAGLALHSLLPRPAFRFAGRSVVITGGSRGLGLAVARRFAAEGARLTLLARNELELERAVRDLRARGAEAWAIPCDVRDREDVQGSLQRVLERAGRIDVLVNNAGVIQAGPFEHMTMDDYAESLAVHFWGPLYAVMAVVPHMKARGEGRIVNVASIGGKIGVPHLSSYAAGKFALVGLSESLRAELAAEGIRVTTICPWLTRTGSYRNVELKGRRSGELTWFGLSDSLPLLTLGAENAARQIVEACRRGQPQLIVGLQGQVAARVHELFPNWTARGLELMDRILPHAAASGGDLGRSGWDVPSPLAPSLLTRLSDRAAARLNQRPEYVSPQE